MIWLGLAAVLLAGSVAARHRPKLSDRLSLASMTCGTLFLLLLWCGEAGLPSARVMYQVGFYGGVVILVVAAASVVLAPFISDLMERPDVLWVRGEDVCGRLHLYRLGSWCYQRAYRARRNAEFRQLIDRDRSRWSYRHGQDNIGPGGFTGGVCGMCGRPAIRRTGVHLCSHCDTPTTGPRPPWIAHHSR